MRFFSRCPGAALLLGLLAVVVFGRLMLAAMKQKKSDIQTEIDDLRTRLTVNGCSCGLRRDDYARQTTCMMLPS